MPTRALMAIALVWVLGAAGPDWPRLNQIVGPAALFAQQPAPVDEFVPIDQLPPQDQLPAAPLLVAAYAFVVLTLFAYVVSLARRLGDVHRDLERLESDLKKSGRR